MSGILIQVLPDIGCVFTFENADSPASGEFPGSTFGKFMKALMPAPFPSNPENWKPCQR